VEAQVVQERREQHRLQQVRLPGRQVAAQQRERRADEEQLVPDAEHVRAEEKPADALGV
jgi:hypothetical protein